MRYRTIAGTEIAVSEVGFGVWTVSSGWWGDFSDAEAVTLLRQGFDRGINFFDTADTYGNGRGETILAQAFPAADRDEIVIATKVFFPMSDRPNMGGLSRKHIQQGCESSLKRLGLDTIDLYQIHRFDRHTPVDEILSALDLLIRQGKVRYVGASSMAAWKFAQCLSASERNGWARFVSRQNHYNLVYREEEREMIPLCEFQGLGVIPWSPLARGMLAGTRSQLGDKSTTRSETDGLDQILYDQPSDWDVVEAVKTVAKQRDLKPAQIALAWLWSRPAVTAPVIGATQLGQLEDAIAAIGIGLSGDEIAALEAPYQAHPVKGLGPKPSMRRN